MSHRARQLSVSLAAGLALALLLATPEVAQACAVCFSGKDDETRVAFIITSVLLTFLPILLVGGVVAWIVRRVRQLERAEAAQAVGLPAPVRALSRTVSR